MAEFFCGQVIVVAYPFVRQEPSANDLSFSESIGIEWNPWKPGTRMEQIGLEDVAPFCDAMGEQQLTVVSIHKPSPRYPARVFFTQKWKDPDGIVFGKTKLRILTVDAFRRRANGYRHEYSIATTKGGE